MVGHLAQYSMARVPKALAGCSCCIVAIFCSLQASVVCTTPDRRCFCFCLLLLPGINISPAGVMCMERQKSYSHTEISWLLQHFFTVLQSHCSSCKLYLLELKISNPLAINMFCKRLQLRWRIGACLLSYEENNFTVLVELTSIYIQDAENKTSS